MPVRVSISPVESVIPAGDLLVFLRAYLPGRWSDFSPLGTFLLPTLGAEERCVLDLLRRASTWSAREGHPESKPGNRATVWTHTQVPRPVSWSMSTEAQMYPEILATGQDRHANGRAATRSSAIAVRSCSFLASSYHPAVRLCKYCPHIPTRTSSRNERCPGTYTWSTGSARKSLRNLVPHKQHTKHQVVFHNKAKTCRCTGRSRKGNHFRCSSRELRTAAANPHKLRPRTRQPLHIVVCVSSLSLLSFQCPSVAINKTTTISDRTGFAVKHVFHYCYHRSAHASKN
jgi:hypothetical protein